MPEGMSRPAGRDASSTGWVAKRLLRLIEPQKLLSGLATPSAASRLSRCGPSEARIVPDHNAPIVGARADAWRSLRSWRGGRPCLRTETAPCPAIAGVWLAIELIDTTGSRRSLAPATTRWPEPGPADRWCRSSGRATERANALSPLRSCDQRAAGGRMHSSGRWSLDAEDRATSAEHRATDVGFADCRFRGVALAERVADSKRRRDVAHAVLRRAVDRAVRSIGLSGDLETVGLRHLRRRRIPS